MFRNNLEENLLTPYENDSFINKIKLSTPKRIRHYSETNDCLSNVDKKINYNFNVSDSGFSDLNNDSFKLGTSVPNDSWISFKPNKNPTFKIEDHDFLDENNKSEKEFENKFVTRRFSLKKNKKFNKIKDLSNENHFSNSNFLKLPSNSDYKTSFSNDKKLTKSLKNLIRNRKRCYSMDDRSNFEIKDNSKHSFDNLAFDNKSFSIYEPIENKKKFKDQNYNETIYVKTPLILFDCNVNEEKFDFNLNDKNLTNFEDDKDFLLKDELKDLNCESGLDLNNDDLAIECNQDQIEYTTKLASDLSKPEIETESLVSFTFQVLFPLLVCGLGNLSAGLLLNKIEKYEVFNIINELYIAIPCLMGLKGNLEMTMASRLSTAANLGIFEHLPQILSITKSNLCLLQCQATVVSLLASLIGVFSQIKNNNSINIHHLLLLIGSNVLTANIACIFLSALMIGVILFCKHRSINPDNVATPIASSLGDISTVFLLGYISSNYYIQLKNDKYWFCPITILIILAITPFSIIIAFKNKHTKKILKTGWLPIIFSMIFSSFAGIILDKVIKVYNGFALFQPIINGVGGNLAAIQASRISTYLHKTTVFGNLPIKELRRIDSKFEKNCSLLANCKNSDDNFEENYNNFENELKVNFNLRDNFENTKDIELENINKKENDENSNNFINQNIIQNNYNNQDTNFKKEKNILDTFKKKSILKLKHKKIKNYFKIIFSSGSIHMKCARLLILITLPMHIIYFYLIQFIEKDKVFETFNFFIFLYLLVAFLQMTTLLILAKILVYQLWKNRLDPDDWAIPILTAVGDLLGTSFLAFIFFAFHN